MKVKKRNKRERERETRRQFYKTNKKKNCTLVVESKQDD